MPYTFAQPDTPTTGTTISSANFGIKVAESIGWLKDNTGILARQGGSAVVCATAGTTNYTPSSVSMQIGVGSATILSGQSAKLLIVTFPVAFANIPFLTFSYVQLNNDYMKINLYYLSTTEARFDIRTINDSNAPANRTVSVNWLAIEAV